MSKKICCVPGCTPSRNNGFSNAEDQDRSVYTVLHVFPDPVKESKRFSDWVHAVGGDLLNLSSDHIAKNRKICSKHFESKYLCRNNRISKSAVPTLYMNEVVCRTKNITDKTEQYFDESADHGLTRLEVCVDSLAGAVAAARGGADCIELCSSLPEGGLTPSAGLLRVVKNTVGNSVEINVMIRCRAGSDFRYAQSEIDTMLADMEIFKSMKVDGFVFGALTEDRDVDIVTCARVIEKAGGTPVTFHRAFDVTDDPLISLEVIIDLGFRKILTSGQRASACDPAGVRLITELIERADGRIFVMPGAGITEDNARSLASARAKYFHSSCKVARGSPAVEAPCMGTNESNVVYVTDVNKVKSLKKVLNNLYCDIPIV